MWNYSLLWVTNLQLNIGDFTPRKLKFIECDSGLLQVPEEAKLFGAEEQQCMTARSKSSRRSTYTMDIFLK